ncbi:hypothetical protein OKW26_004227 [Paraburkholderia sp. 32]
MAATERITMTMRELDRYKVIQDVADGVLRPWRAAKRLGLTTRQIRRLVGRLREHGPQGLVSGRRAMAGANGELVTLYREIRRDILDLQKEPG